MLKNDILNLVRPEFRDIEPYRMIDKDGFALLDSNENPYCFIKNKRYNRYPDIQSKKLLKRLSDLYNVDAKNIFYARGSSEIIELLVKLFCTPFKDSVLICSPTYMMYPRILQLASVNCVNITLKDNLQLDVEKIIEAGKRNDVKLIFIPNPNAPLGNLMNKNDLLKIVNELQNDCYIVIDEAYIEWTNEDGFIEYTKKYKNLCVMRTLSKYYGLADLRIGSFIGNEVIRDRLLAIAAPYSIPSAVYNIAIKALDNKYFEFYRKNKENILLERDKITAELKKLKYIKRVYDSQTSFILVISDKSDEIIKYLAKNNILIRSQESQVHNSLRISIGNPKENKKLIKLLKEIK